MVTSEQIAADLEAFLRKQFLIPGDDAFFTHEVNLWQEGYVDSAGVIEVIAYLEDRYRVTIPDAVLHEPAFTRITGMAQIMARLTNDD